MSPPMVLIFGMSIVFGILASLLNIVAVSTDLWETSTYNESQLRAVPGLVMNNSVFRPEEGYYKVVVENRATENITRTVHHLRDTFGGIWKACDKISDKLRAEKDYAVAADNEAPYLRYKCFQYIHDYQDRKKYLDEDGISLVHMQNSAASCCIVGLLCLATAAVTGALGLWLKQVPACMVTGVMYSVAGVFLCFSLVIMMAKMGDQRECSTLDAYPDNKHICHSRTVALGWSVPIAWVSFSFFLFAFAFWLFLARCLRLEKSKSLL